MAYTYLAKLSPRQKMWFIVSVAAVLLISALGILNEPDRPSQAPNQFTVNMSIREIAPKLEVAGKGLARELALPLDTPKEKPLSELGISQEQLEHATTLTSWIAEKLSLYRVIVDEEKCDGCGYSWPSASRIFGRGARIGILILSCCFVAGCVDRPNWKIRPQGSERLLNLLLF